MQGERERKREQGMRASYKDECTKCVECNKVNVRNRRMDEEEKS